MMIETYLHEYLRRNADKKEKIETFTLDPTNHSPKTLYFCIPAMREWAEKNLIPVALEVTPHKGHEVQMNNGISDEALMWKVSQGPPPGVPCIICLDMSPGNDQLVDGNHAYAAMGKLLPLLGLEMTVIQTYAFFPDVWIHFCYEEKDGGDNDRPE